MYSETIYDAGKTQEHYKRYNYPCEMQNGKPVRRHRGPRQNSTPEDVQKYNEIIRERRVIRKMNANFKEGDLFLTLTYPSRWTMGDEYPTLEQAERNLENYREALRRLYKKHGIEFKWMASTEIGKLGAIHHHIILPEIECSHTVIKKWKRYGGRAFLELAVGNDLKRLATYIAKSDTKQGKTHYSCSRNLVEPKERTRKVKSNSWRDNPVVPRGWILDKDSLVTGINPVTGHGYQFYRLVQLE